MANTKSKNITKSTPQITGCNTTDPFEEMNARDKETVTQVLDRLLGELDTTAVLVDDLRNKAFAEGESKCDTKTVSLDSLESQAHRAALKAEGINRNLQSIVSRL